MLRKYADADITARVAKQINWIISATDQSIRSSFGVKL